MKAYLVHMGDVYEGTNETEVWMNKDEASKRAGKIRKSKQGEWIKQKCEWVGGSSVRWVKHPEFVEIVEHEVKGKFNGKSDF